MAATGEIDREKAKQVALQIMADVASAMHGAMKWIACCYYVIPNTPLVMMAMVTSTSGRMESCNATSPADWPILVAIWYTRAFLKMLLPAHFQ